MAHVVFFGKPTCGGNARQRAALAASGHALEVRDLFAEPWTAERLAAFLDPLPPADWFNRSAVKVKAGEVVPERFGRAEALALLMADPPLIRRPLLEIHQGPEIVRLAGWDAPRIDRLIGLSPQPKPAREGCAHPAGQRCAAHPAEAPTPLPRVERSIDFGPLPAHIDALLQAGVGAHRTDVAAADALFRTALAEAPDALPVYLCLYKIHTYSGRLDAALDAAQGGLAAAAAQAGLSGDWRLWPSFAAADGPARFALYTLKALAFIRLRRNETADAREILTRLAVIDPGDTVGGSVVAALADGAQAGR